MMVLACNLTRAEKNKLVKKMVDGIEKRDEYPLGEYSLDWEWKRNTERQRRIKGEYSLYGILIHRTKGPTGRMRTAKHRLGRIFADSIYVAGQRLAFWQQAEEKMQALELSENTKNNIFSEIAATIRPLTENEVIEYRREAEEAGERLKRILHNEGNADDAIWFELFLKEGRVETEP